MRIYKTSDINIEYLDYAAIIFKQKAISETNYHNPIYLEFESD